MTKVASKHLLQEFLEKHRLPQGFAAQALEWYAPLICELQARLSLRSRTLLLGINGTQGSGKSTLADYITESLQEQGYCVANLSLDDFYLHRAERERLAREVHPLLASRGVPGTHDLELLQSTLDRLTRLAAQERLAIPRFSKAQDDRLPEDDWSRITGPIDLVILEGWCVGTTPQTAAELEPAINDLERIDDSDGRWRSYVNDALEAYQAVFVQLDQLLMLRAPAFASVLGWRRLQEAKLISQTTEYGNANRTMDESELNRFIQHFQRLTEHSLRTLPARADTVLFLDDGQRVCGQCTRPRINPRSPGE